MKNFLHILFTIFSIIILFISYDFIKVYYESKDLNSLYVLLFLCVVDILALTFFIYDFIKVLNTKYSYILNRVSQTCNQLHNVNNKVIDILTYYKEHSKETKVIIDFCKSIKHQGVINQDSLSSIRDNIRNIIQANLDLLTIVKDDKTNINLIKLIEISYENISNNHVELKNLIKSNYSTHNKFLDIYKDNNNNLITIDKEFKNIDTKLEIIKDNQKYITDQLIISKSKRVTKTKIKAKSESEVN